MNDYRNKILELFDEGLVGKDELITNLVNFISESDAYEFLEQYYDEDYDDQPRWATKFVPGTPRF